MPATDTSIDPARQEHPSSGNPAPMPATEALATAKAHFVARGWRPLAIQPPSLGAQCSDVSAVLLMNDDGSTVWLSARDWSALVNPIDAFRREMTCVRSAKVQEAILVYDGEFPEAVIEVAAQEPGLKLVDAMALRAMSGGGAFVAAKAAPASRRARMVAPARNAVASLHAHATRVVDTRLLPATERFVSKRLAQRIRQMDGERRQLRHLVTGGLVVLGFAVGFLLFNLVILIRTPDDDAAQTRVAAAPRPELPAPLPPPQGYVAQAADAAMYVSVNRPAIVPRSVATLAVAPSAMSVSHAMPNAVAPSASIQGGLDDYALSQMRADEAMRVIADDTPEMRTSPPVLSAQHVSPRPVPPADPAMVDGEAVAPDPADVE